jgi:hypothetical protein
MQSNNDTPKEAEAQQPFDEGLDGSICSAGCVQWTEAKPDREGYYWRRNPMGNTKIVFVTEELDVMTIYGDFRPVAEYPQDGMWAGPIPLPNA